MRINKILLVDDQEAFTKWASDVVTSKFLCDITICHSLVEAVTTLKKDKFDLLILDVYVNMELGTDILKKFIDLPPVIIISSDREFAVDSYEYESIENYLLKPVESYKLVNAVSKALRFKMEENSITERNFIFIKSGRKVVKFYYDKIDYIMAYGIYSKIVFDDNLIVVNETISNLEEILPKHIFRRIHKSFIVNIDHLTEYDNKNLFINGKDIPIGISYKKSLESILRLLKVN
ncbi:LytTR family DNA-binding domain-containing protein [Nostoc sp. CHAB 5834]|nr:LytTR family DNA-binding domain-containing protein [Nostoc sp. CHAB 5834]